MIAVPWMVCGRRMDIRSRDPADRLPWVDVDSDRVKPHISARLVTSHQDFYDAGGACRAAILMASWARQNRTDYVLHDETAEDYPSRRNKLSPRLHDASVFTSSLPLFQVRRTTGSRGNADREPPDVRHCSTYPHDPLSSVRL